MSPPTVERPPTGALPRDSADERLDLISGVARRLAHRGWFPAGGGSLSVALSPNPLTILTTGAGAPKDRLQPRDTLILDDEGVPMTPHSRAADRGFEISRCLIRQGAGAVIHSFTTWGLLAAQRQTNESISIAGHELLRAFSNWSDECGPLTLPIMDGRQDLPTLIRRLETIHSRKPRGQAPGFLARGFGLFAWGDDLASAERHTEALHFFLELVGRQNTQSETTP